MKRLLTLAVISFVGSFSLSAQSKKELEAQVKKLQTEIAELKKPKVVDLNTANKKAGYGMGVLFANNIKGQGGDSLDVEAMLAAINDVFRSEERRVGKE